MASDHFNETAPLKHFLDSGFLYNNIEVFRKMGPVNVREFMCEHLQNLLAINVYKDNMSKALKTSSSKILYSILRSYISDRNVALSLSLQYSPFCDFSSNKFKYQERLLDFVTESPIVIGAPLYYTYKHK